MKAHHIEKYTSIADLIERSKGLCDGSKKGKWTSEHPPLTPMAGYFKSTYPQIVQSLIAGDIAYVAKAERMVAQLKDVELPSTFGRRRRRDVVGTRCNMGEYMAGSPTCMRRKVTSEDDTQPLRIAVDMFISCAFTPQQVEARGLAILALLVKIMQFRPVELFVFCESRDNWDSNFQAIQLCEINSKPLDLATSAVALCDADISRRIFFPLLVEVVTDGSLCPPKAGREAQVVRAELLGLRENDLLIESQTLGSYDLSNPVGWVDKQMETLKERLTVE